MDVNFAPDGVSLGNQAHAVDWQLTTGVAAQYGEASRRLREQITALESRAMGLLHAAVAHPGGTAAQRSFASLEAEITRLRADLAWLRADARACAPSDGRAAAPPARAHAPSAASC